MVAIHTQTDPNQIARLDWLKVGEVAALIRTGERSVYKAITSGELRAVPINSRGDLRVARSAVQEWLDKQAAVARQKWLEKLAALMEERRKTADTPEREAVSA